VPEAAIAELGAAFRGQIAARPGAKRCVVVGEVARALARLLVPSAELLASRAIQDDDAVGLVHWNGDAASLLLGVALDLVRKASAGVAPEIPLERLKALAPDRDALPEHTLLRDAAERRGLFAHSLDLPGGPLLVVGSGSRQRRLLGLLPDATAFAGRLATNKNAACELLARHGIPVPRGETVRTREDAHAAAARLGFPVTLKVAVGSRQRGVVPCVISARALDRSLDLFSRGVELRLERHVRGRYFRAFVANGELVACATAALPTVTGDGAHTVLALVARDHPWLQAMLASGDAAVAANARAIVDHVLAGHDHAPRDVLAKGETVPVAFPTSEGHARDVTALVHAGNRALLVRAARVLGMFWTGIDVLAPRIDVPLVEEDAAILEANEVPAFAFHGCPLEGPGVDMARAIFEAFFGERRANVPVVLVLGKDREALAGGAIRGLGKKKLRAVRAVDREGGIGLAAALDPEADAIVIAEEDGVLLERGLAVPGVDVVLLGRGTVDGGLAAFVEGARRRAKGVLVRGGGRTIAEVMKRSRA
jgi:hypothetical protein